MITPAYAAAFGLLYVGLSVRTLKLRRHLKIAVGDGGDLRMLRAMRAHANFSEYVPLGLILIYFRELQGAGPAWIHGLCGVLLAGRIAHAIGVSRVREDVRLRVAGMGLTFTVIISASVRLLAGYLP